MISFQKKTRPFVTQISAGSSHSLILTQEDGVFSFGSNRHGRLGLGDRYSRLRPSVIKDLNDVDIIQVSAGDAHSLVLTSEGDVYSFGCGTHGQLGFTDDCSDRDRPSKLPKLSERVARVCASRTRSRLLLHDGRVILFGADITSSPKSNTISVSCSKDDGSTSSSSDRLILPEFSWGSS